MFRSLSFGLLATYAQAENWAVLVAGSKGYTNYRHQADVCHSYAVVKSKGIPEENIILMMYNDVVNAGDNPFKGQLFNQPDGPDVYATCGDHIDYTGDDVNPQNFLNVLTGQGTGKVLKSTADDNVFVFFSDHGSPGLISFPSEAMHKDDLQGALQTMSDTKMFNKLAIYIEACESGSMFEMMQIPGVYALSAASPDEPSWGAYCGASATVNGENLYTCLADMFSKAWMEDAEGSDITQESLDQQFSGIQNIVTRSAATQWGDKSFTSDMVSEYLGSAQAPLTATKTSTPYSENHPSDRIDIRRFIDMYTRQDYSSDRLVAGLRMRLELTQQLRCEHVFRYFAAVAYPDDVEAQQEARRRKANPLNKQCELEGHRSFRQHCAGQFDAGSGFSLGFHQVVVNVCADIVEKGMNLAIGSAAKLACEYVESQPDAVLFGSTRPRSSLVV